MNINTTSSQSMQKLTMIDHLAKPEHLGKSKETTLWKKPEPYKVTNKKLIDHIEANIESNNLQLFFYGKTGLGKTYLAESIFEYLKWKYPACRDKYFNAATLYRDYLRVVSGNYSDRSDAIAKKLNALRGEIVFLDDLGNETETEASKGFMNETIDNLYKHWKSGHVKTAIITTNLLSDALEKRYGDRTVSRLVEMFHFSLFKGEDFRRMNIKRL